MRSLRSLVSCPEEALRSTVHPLTPLLPVGARRKGHRGAAEWTHVRAKGGRDFSVKRAALGSLLVSLVRRL